jgi:Leucine-rich repeat (LRR) protein
MTSLRSLCMNCNEIRDFSNLNLPLLTSLSLCRNRITLIGVSIARLVSLQSLVLDWNAVRDVPLAIRALTALEASRQLRRGVVCAVARARCVACSFLLVVHRPPRCSA